VGKTKEDIAGYFIHAAHFVNQKAVQEEECSIGSGRASRSGGQQQERRGFYTFRRNDVVQYVHTSKESDKREGQTFLVRALGRWGRCGYSGVVIAWMNWQSGISPASVCPGGRLRRL
jgi:hypothetical protein